MEHAIRRRPGVDVEVVWHPFFLNAGIADGETVDKFAYIERKLGRAYVEQNFISDASPIKQAGRRIGLEFNYNPAGGTPLFHTLKAHRLMELALARGGAELQNRVQEALFVSYFTHERNLGDPAVLAAAAGDAGMDAAEVEGYLRGSAGTREVEAKCRAASGVVQYVPWYTYETLAPRATAVAGLPTGGLREEEFVAVIDRLAAEATAPRRA